MLLPSWREPGSNPLKTKTVTSWPFASAVASIARSDALEIHTFGEGGESHGSESWQIQAQLTILFDMLMLKLKTTPCEFSGGDFDLGFRLPFALSFCCLLFEP